MSARNAIYLDSNAGAPLKPEVREALRALLLDREFSNPSSVHVSGRKAQRLLSEAREAVASSIGCLQPAQQIIFTSSGSEANQMAIRSVFEPLFEKGKKPHWITTPIEHDSNLQMVSWIKSRGGDVSTVPVSSEGEIEVDRLPEFFRPETALVSGVWANNETGVLLDVKRWTRQCKRAGIKVHLDAAQAWGKVGVNVSHLDVDFVTFSGHKIGAPGGIGFLCCASGQLARGVVLGKQELLRRGGTENLLGAVGMGVAAMLIQPKEWALRVEPQRNRLQETVCAALEGVRVNGKLAPRVANTLNISFEGLAGEGLILALDLEGYSVSAGSACSSGVMEPSHVLLAMGRSKDEAMSAIRISMADEMNWEDLLGFVNCLKRVVDRQRGQMRRK